MDSKEEVNEAGSKIARDGENGSELSVKAILPAYEIVMIDPELLQPNLLIESEPMEADEFESLKVDIGRTGVLNPLLVKKDGTVVAGENRYRIALELKRDGNQKCSEIPVRFYDRDLSKDEEFEILESDNLFRRHMNPSQKKIRIISMIKRKYGTELDIENRGGDRRSKDDSHPLIENKNIAKMIADNEKIALGTAKNYVTEIRKNNFSKKEEFIKTNFVSEEDRRRGELLKKEILNLTQKIEEMRQNMRELENAKRAKVRELKSIGGVVAVKLVSFNLEIFPELFSTLPLLI